MLWGQAFICMLAYKKKHTTTTQETQYQPEKWSFKGFLPNTGNYW
jgi:hypothetical protein